MNIRLASGRSELSRDLVDIRLDVRNGFGRNQDGALLALAKKEFEAFLLVRISAEQDLESSSPGDLVRAELSLEDIRPLAASCSTNVLAPREN